MIKTSKGLMRKLKNLPDGVKVELKYDGSTFTIEECQIDGGFYVNIINIMGWDGVCYETAKEAVEYIFGKEY